MDRLSVTLAGNLIPGKQAVDIAETVTSPKSSYESWPPVPGRFAHAENRVRLQIFISSCSPVPIQGWSTSLFLERSMAGCTAPSDSRIQPGCTR